MPNNNQKPEKSADEGGQVDAILIKNAFIEIFDAAAFIQHWHDTSYNKKTDECERMIVSAHHVRLLWDVIDR